MKRRLLRDEEPKLFSDINVTPLVDVTLVLLIIFMITAPFIFKGIQVDLPKVTYGKIKKEQNPIVITIDRKKRIYIGNKRVSIQKLSIKLKILSKHSKRKVIFKCDRRVPYGYAARILSIIKGSGFSEIGVVVRTGSKR